MNYSKSPAVTFWWSLQNGASLGLTGRVSTWHAADFNRCLWAANKQNTRRSSSIYYLFYSNYFILFWCFCIFEHFLEQELIKFYLILSYISAFLIFLSTLKRFKKNFFIFRLVVSKQFFKSLFTQCSSATSVNRFWCVYLEELLTCLSGRPIRRVLLDLLQWWKKYTDVLLK